MKSSGPIPLEALGQPVRDRMFGVALELLEGVGIAETTERMVSRGLRAAEHVRRALTDAEVTGLPAAWLAIPAVDPGTIEEYEKVYG